MQPVHDPLRNLIHCAAERAVRDVYVDGEAVVKDRRVSISTTTERSASCRMPRSAPADGRRRSDPQGRSLFRARAPIRCRSLPSDELIHENSSVYVINPNSSASCDREIDKCRHLPFAAPTGRTSCVCPCLRGPRASSRSAMSTASSAPMLRKAAELEEKAAALS